MISAMKTASARACWVVVFSLGLIFLPTTPAMAARTSADVSAVLSTTALRPGDSAMMAVVINVHPGLHAQSHKPLDPNLIPLVVKLDPNPSATFGEIAYPPGQTTVYPQLGAVNVYTNRVVVFVPLSVAKDAAVGPTTISGSVRLQACNDSMCFPPETQKFQVDTQILAAGAATQANQPELFTNAPAATQPVNQIQTPQPAAPATAPAAAGAIPPSQPPAVMTASNEAEWPLTTAYGAAFLAGLLFNVMPCVLPVLPLKAIGFYEVSQHHRARSLMFGFVFSIGLIAVFAVLALLVLVLRVIDWGGLFSKAWFVWPMVAILTAMGLGLLGAWTTTLPTALYSLEPRHDTISGNFFWGALSAILATPCTAPLLPAVLAWAIARPAYVGVPAMLMVGVGMAAPYLILSAFPELARRIPRVGAWSELFKQMMGFMLLAAVAFFAGGRLVNGPNYWWIIVAVVAVAAIYLVARTVQLTKNSGPVIFNSALAVAMLGGTIAWTARITGLLSPRASVMIGGTSVTAQWNPYSDAFFKQQRDAGKIVLVKFTANWCASCQYIEGTVFQDPAVWNALHADQAVAIKVDLTEDDAPGKSLLLSLNPAGGIPLTAIYAPGTDHPVVLTSVYTSGELLRTLDGLPKPAPRPPAS
jgi:thiol:disulfide interchange protein DsbD